MNQHFYRISLIALLLMLIFNSCKNCDDPGQEPCGCPACPVVRSIEPSVGSPEDLVSIFGDNLGGFNISEDNVFFNGIKALVIEINEDEIIAQVPNMVSTGPVVVEIQSLRSDDDGISVEPLIFRADPIIESVTPTQGKKGTYVTISGESFNSTNSEMNVFFNGIEANIISSSETEITVLVPEAAQSGPIMLSMNGETYHGPHFEYLPTITVETFAGMPGINGVQNCNAASALFNQPQDIAIAHDGTIYLTDSKSHSIRKIDLEGNVTTFAGSDSGFVDGLQEAAKFKNPYGMTIDQAGNLFITERGNPVIRKVNPYGLVTTVVGGPERGYVDGDRLQARFAKLSGITLGNDGNLYVVDSDNYRIRKVTLAGWVSTFAGSGVSGINNGVGTNAQFGYPLGIGFDPNGDFLITDGLYHQVKKMNLFDSVVTTFTGIGLPGYYNGPALAAQFSSPQSTVVGPDGSIYIADTGNNRIRRISKDGHVTNFAGTGSPGHVDGDSEIAEFNAPNGLAFDAQGRLYVVDTQNHVVRRILIE